MGKEKIREMNSVELAIALKEMRVLENGRVEKIYQKGRQVRMKIYCRKGEKELVFEPGKFFLTNYKRRAPGEPPSFCMLLRKHLTGKRIAQIRQRGFERIVEMEFEDKILIFEIFSKGNVILCERDYTIIMPLEVQLWKEREIMPGKLYKPPPALLNPFSMSEDEFCSMIRGQKKIASFLAADFALGGIYAEELCLRAGVEKTKKCSELSENEKKNLYREMQRLRNERVNPYLVYENSEPVDFAPFELLLHREREKRYFPSFNEVLDEFYTYWEAKAAEREGIEKESEAEEKIKRIIERQKEVVKNLEELEKAARKKAEILFNNLELVERIFSALRKARELGLSWEEIKERVSLDSSPEARAVKDIREHEGKLLLAFGETDVEVDFTLSPVENAQRYYELAKKYRKKIESARKRMEEIKASLKEQIRKLKEKKEREAILPKKKKTKKKWYEKFRWSFTSEGFLVVAGKDATQNEVLYKKYLERDDIVLHADIAGAPLTVIKSQGREITPLAIREAAEIAAAYSRAWKLKLGSVDVYWVLPEQVSKTPPAGQYLPKGSFMIYGEKNYLRKTEVRLAIGVMMSESEAKVFAGSILGARAHCKYFVTVFPGNIPKHKAGEVVKLKLMQKALPEDKELIEKIPLDEFVSILPGECGEIMG